MQGFPSDLAAALTQETRGEIVRWAERPNAGRILLQSLPVLIFAIPWTAFTGFMLLVILAAVSLGGPPPQDFGSWGYAGAFVAALFVLPFVVIGLAMLAMPFLSWRTAKRTAHAITDRRILSLTLGSTKKVVSILAQHIISVERTERADGTGSLKITTGYRTDGDGDVVKNTEEINHVPNVHSAERLIMGLRPPQPR